MSQADQEWEEAVRRLLLTLREKGNRLWVDEEAEIDACRSLGRGLRAADVIPRATAEREKREAVERALRDEQQEAA